MCPQYAAFDHTASGATPVIGWYDTDAFVYANLPDMADLLPVSPTQWAAGPLNAPSAWAVSEGRLVSYSVPPPPGVAAQIAFAAQVARGISITSLSMPGVNGIYALDTLSTGQVFQIGLFAKQFETFPSGAGVQMYPDVDDQFHLFTVPVFISFLQAVAALTSAQNMQQALMARGGSPAWPDPVAVIV